MFLGIYLLGLSRIKLVSSITHRVKYKLPALNLI